MSEVERLIRYCKVDTQSNPDNENVTPSSEKQFDLAKMLKQELEELGLEDVTLDEHCYVYAWLPSNVEGAAKTVGFIAHMDTAPDFSGTNVNPRIIENYDGNDIVLNDAMATKVEDFPELKALKGKTLLVSDGTTLLGADDKAGIVSIMEALVYLKNHPEINIVDFNLYNVEAFNRCENNNEVLLAFKSWESVHPLIRIIPVEWDYTMPFGILHSKKPSIKVKRLINAINKVK